MYKNSSGDFFLWDRELEYYVFNLYFIISKNENITQHTQISFWVYDHYFDVRFARWSLNVEIKTSNAVYSFV